MQLQDHQHHSATSSSSRRAKEAGSDARLWQGQVRQLQRCSTSTSTSTVRSGLGQEASSLLGVWWPALGEELPARREARRSEPERLAEEPSQCQTASLDVEKPRQTRQLHDSGRWKQRTPSSTPSTSPRSRSSSQRCHMVLTLCLLSLPALLPVSVV